MELVNFKIILSYELCTRELSNSWSELIRLHGVVLLITDPKLLVIKMYIKKALTTLNPYKTLSYILF